MIKEIIIHAPVSGEVNSCSGIWFEADFILAAAHLGEVIVQLYADASERIIVPGLDPFGLDAPALAVSGAATRVSGS
jgi:hypothetical protein